MRTMRAGLSPFHAALIFGCGAVLVHLALTLFYRNDLPVRITLSDLILLSADSLAATSLLFAAKRSGPLGTGSRHRTPKAGSGAGLRGARIAWMVLAVGQSGRAIGDLIVAISEIGFQHRGLPPTGDVIFLVADSLFVLGLVLLAEGGRSSAERLRRLLDLGIAMIAALLVSWTLVILPRTADSRIDTFALLIPLAYAAVDVVLIFVLIDLLFGWRAPGGRVPILLLAGGALAKVAAGYMGLVLCPPNGACLSGDWDASMWMAGAVIIGLGGLLQAMLSTSPNLESPAALEGGDKPSNYEVYFSYLWVVAAYLLLVWNYGHVPPIGFSILLWGTGAITALVILRQILVLNENRQLYASAQQEVAERGRADAEIRRLNEELEQRVIARTAQLETANRELQNEIAERKRAEEEAKELQEFNQSIVQDMSEGIVVEDSEGNLIFVNSAAAAQLGYTPGELVGRHWTAIVPPDQQSIVLEADERRARGERDRYELQLVRSDGQRVTVLAAGSPRLDGGTRGFAGTMAVFVDITARKRAEEALQKQQQELQIILDSVPAWIFFKDRENRFIRVNKAFAEIMGMPRGELEGRSLFDLYPEEQADAFWRDDKEVMASGLAKTNIIEPMDTQKGKFWAQTDKMPYRDEGDNIIGIIGFALDVTERKRAEEALALERNLLRTLIDTVPDYLYVKDTESRFVVGNLAIAQSFGKESPEEIYGRSDFDYHAPELAAQYHADEQAILSSGKPLINREEYVVDSAGNQRWLITTKVPLRDSQEKIVGLVGVGRDISERRRMEAELKVSNEKLTVWVNQLEQSSREIALLGQMGDLLQSCRNADEAYQVIVGSGRALFPAESGALFVLNNSRNLVEMVANWGESRPRECTFTPDDCWGLRRGRPYVVEAPESDVVCPHLAQDVPANYLCIPMMAQGETLGVLHLRHAAEPLERVPGRAGGSHGRPGVDAAENRPEAPGQQFTVSKQQLAAAVAEHIALSLASLQLRETLRSQAIRDPLTGLFNRRYMEETIERELHRAARNGTPLGIIMFDIDHFKDFNDRFGHGAGDAILRELGAYLEGKMRREDIACRYGGDEFILVLPECSIENSRRRAEQIREEFKCQNVKFHRQFLPLVSLSFGVAASSSQGSNAESLLQKADQALYRAKAEGRDRVVVAD